MVDITKDAQQATAEFAWEKSAPKLPPKRQRNNHDQVEFDRAVELLNSAERDLSSSESNGAAAGWRNAALANVRNAKAFVDKAMRDSWWR